MQINEVENLNQDLIKQMYEIHKSVFLSHDQMDFLPFENEFKQNNRVYFVACENKEVIGYIGAINCVDSFEVIGIGIKATGQRKGIGTLLLQKLFKKAKDCNINKIFLEVDDKNISAQTFYKKNGFTITNIRKKYYKDNDALIMMCSNF